MNNDEAKFILQAYRPGGRDATDGTFSAALAQAQRDPMLGAWFARTQAYDAAVAAKLREVTPPPGLREAILAGGRVSGRRPVRRMQRWQTWLALAASLVVLLVVGDVWEGHRTAAAQTRYAEFAINDVLHGQHQEAHGAVMTGLVKLLAKSDLALPGPLPVNLGELKDNGCRTLSFAGQAVMEVCFSRGGEMYHLYMLPRGGVPGAEIAKTPALLAMNGMAVAVWSDGAHDFAVVSPAGMAALKKLAT